jgi:hypothetical protein
VAAPAGDPDAGPASSPEPPGGRGGREATAAPGGRGGREATVAPGGRGGREATVTRPDDALDLGSALLPVLLKAYGKQLAGGLVALLVLRWVVRRLRG